MAKIRPIRNPKFEEESLVGISWVRVIKDKLPHRRHAICCGKTIAQDEIVVSFPHIPKGGSWQASVFVHKKCLVKYLAEVPDEFSIVQARIENIKDQFIRT